MILVALQATTRPGRERSRLVIVQPLVLLLKSEQVDACRSRLPGRRTASRDTATVSGQARDRNSFSMVLLSRVS